MNWQNWLVKEETLDSNFLTANLWKKEEMGSLERKRQLTFLRFYVLKESMALFGFYIIKTLRFCAIKGCKF